MCWGTAPFGKIDRSPIPRIGDYQGGNDVHVTRNTGAGRLIVIGAAAAMTFAACSSSAAKTTSSATAAASGVATAAPTATTSAAATTAPSATTPSSAAATTAAAGTAAPASPTGSPIVIGILTEETGPIAGTQADVAPAAKAWADWVNSNGGINKHPVQVKVLDTAGDPAKAQVAAQQLIDDKTVVAIQMYSASAEASIAPLLSKSGIAISGVGYDTASWGADIRPFKLILPALPNFFTTAATISAIVDTQAAGGKAAGMTTMAVATCSESPNCAQAEPLYKAGAAEAGLAYDGINLVSASAANYTAECVKVIADGVDFFQMSTSGDVGQRIVKDCVAQGYKGWFGASGGTPDSSLIDSGVNWAGGLDGFPWWSTKPAVKEFNDVMTKAKANHESPVITGLWANLQLFRKAMSKASDTVTREEVLAAYNSVSNESLGGLLAQPVTFKAGAPAPAIDCVFLYKLEGGKFTSPAGDLTPTCFTPTPPKP